MKPNPLTVTPTARFAEIGEKFIATRFNYLYVTDHNRLVGAVSLHDIKNFLNAPELAALVIAGDILQDHFPVVRADATLTEALERFSQATTNVCRWSTTRKKACSWEVSQKQMSSSPWPAGTRP